MKWSEAVANRVWHLTTEDGDPVGTVTRYVTGERGFQAWLRGPDPKGTVVGVAYASSDAARRAVEQALVERLAQGGGA